MKSLEELLAIKEKAQAQLAARDADGNDGIRVVVGMATCGIAAGARPVLKALVDEVAKRNVQHVSVTQTGCIGMCQYEPIVEVYVPGKEKVTYVKMNVDKALEMTGLEELRYKSVLALSGGELQRVFLAQILAQNPKLLILDEPTNHLDLIYQKQIFNLVQDWLKIPGHAVISVVHDLSLAKAYGTHALLMHKGEIMASGKARDVFTRDKLENAYSMDVFDWMNTMLGQWK